MESSGFVVLLDGERLADLRRVYAVLARVPASGPKYIRELLAAHVKAVGKVRVTTWCCCLLCVGRYGGSITCEEERRSRSWLRSACLQHERSTTPGNAAVLASGCLPLEAQTRQK